MTRYAIDYGDIHILVHVHAKIGVSYQFAEASAVAKEVPKW